MKDLKDKKGMKFVVKRNRFRETHSDELGTYGTNYSEWAVVDEDGSFVCWVSELEIFLKSAIAGMVDCKEIKKIVERCK